MQQGEAPQGSTDVLEASLIRLSDGALGLASTLLGFSVIFLSGDTVFESGYLIKSSWIALGLAIVTGIIARLVAYAGTRLRSLMAQPIVFPDLAVTRPTNRIMDRLLGRSARVNATDEARDMAEPSFQFVTADEALSQIRSVREALGPELSEEDREKFLKYSDDLISRFSKQSTVHQLRIFRELLIYGSIIFSQIGLLLLLAFGYANVH